MTAPAELTPLFDSFFTSPCCSQYDSLQLSEPQCLSVLQSQPARTLFGLSQQQSSEGEAASAQTSFSETLRQNISRMFKRLEDSSSEQNIVRSQLLHIGYAALCSFLQADVAGPPLPAGAANLVIPADTEQSHRNAIREQMIRELTVDGEAAYQLIPLVELFVVAKTVLNCLELMRPEDSTLMLHLARLRVNFLHQKILSEDTDTLRSVIYEDLDIIADHVIAPSKEAAEERNEVDKVKFLLERAAIHTHHGQDEKARRDLERAADLNCFEFAVTGRLGKRTKFQTRDITQLVVLAKSRESGDAKNEKKVSDGDDEAAKPKKLDLNDDTLLEAISFAKDEGREKTEKSLTVQDESSLPSSLAGLDPSNQPQLSTLDSITLLSIASAITNTSPDHGLTREETLPYATRVLDSGSTNWQVYSQALLVRSRIEGHASRTVERSVLQLQTLVDQVIADTNSSMEQNGNESTEAREQQSTTFLPRPQASESAPAIERLKYLWYIDFSTRWGLEAELAKRWVSLGGLRTALEIYERLHMWAEAALCHAATDREDQARLIARRQLFKPSTPDSEGSLDGPELDVLPPDAPRLFCILGDIDTDPKMYERAWEVSNHRYARAQRSLARHYVSQKPPAFEEAEEAYKKSLNINRLNHLAWFALGCIQLELEKWSDAVESFTRTIQLEESDAEAWSNLAAALVNVPAPSVPEEQKRVPAAEDEEETAPQPSVDPYKPKRDALAALHRAARFKHDDHRIWDNMLTVASSIPPPQIPFRDILLAFRRTIEIRGPKRGEKSIDVAVLSAIINTLTTDYSFDDPKITLPDKPHQLRPGTVPAAILNLVDEIVVPLITHSPQLWLLVSKIESWRGRPVQALEAHEKAWRAAVASSSKGAFEMGEEKEWMVIVAATETLVRKGYAVFGGMEREQDDEGEGELVAKDWRFKSRSAVRGILGKGKEFWEGTEGWDSLKELAADVSGGSH